MLAYTRVRDFAIRTPRPHLSVERDVFKRDQGIDDRELRPYFLIDVIKSSRNLTVSVDTQSLRTKNIHSQLQSSDSMRFPAGCNQL